ncbi:replicative DNA helicase [Streptomyces sp. NPDC048484]|uniref:replicative DNA helicase n=1 Tax=Streptomyces sp. NPDC048484 TaxID=3155146 RepID=UPI00343D75A0
MTDEQDETDQPPPHDMQAEKAVLGGMLLSSRAIDEVEQILRGPEDFYSGTHATVFSDILSLYATGARVDPISLTAHMRTTGNLVRIGGPAHLHALVQAVPTSANAQYYAEIVRDCATRAGLGVAADELKAQSRDASQTPAEILDSAMGTLQNLAVGSTEEMTLHASDHFLKLVEHLENPDSDPILPTPWPELDKVVRIRAGQLVIVGARPGGGKSLYGSNLAAHAALHHNIPTVIFSMEMSGEMVESRIAADQAKVSLTVMETKSLTDGDWARLANHAQVIGQAPLIIDDTSRLTLGRLRARLRWMESTFNRPVGLVVIDYIQQVQCDPAWGKQRWEQLGTLSRELKIMAGEFKVPVLALTQLNRGPEQRTDKKPTMGDLRESGSFENDADIVMLLHREPVIPASGMSEAKVRTGEVDVIVAKNRQGQNEVAVPLAFQGRFARLSHMGS